MKFRKLKKTITNAFLFLILLIGASSFLIPILLTITNSFMTEKEIQYNYGSLLSGQMGDGVHLKLIPDLVSLQQYNGVLFQSPEFLLKFWNAVFLVIPLVFFQILVALGASYCFSRFRGKFKEVVFFIYILLMIMPYQVSLVPNLLVCKWLGIYDTYLAVILPGVFSTFSVYIITKYMRRIPAEYAEAAKIDGANEWYIFTRIYVPMSKSAIACAAILIFIDYWNMVEQPLVQFTSSEKYPLSIFLAQINKGEIGVAFAAAVVYMIPTILVYLYGEDYLVKGVSQVSGLKG